MSAQPEPFRIAIVDDEPLARLGLVSAIKRITSSDPEIRLEVGDICANGVVAIEAIRQNRPDILLLDIAMPEVDGFAVLERLEPEETPAAVIFVTAYAEHALRAFEAEALDYVVKPVPDRRLKAALERAISRVKERHAAREQLEAPTLAKSERAYLQQIVIPERGRQIVIPVGDVEWFQGDTYYVRVHAAPRERLLRERMHVLETLLDPASFMRIHRSAIVRISAIREIRSDSPYAFSVVLASGAIAPLSRDKRRALEETMTKRSSNG